MIYLWPGGLTVSNTDQMKHILGQMPQHARECRPQKLLDTPWPVAIFSLCLKVIQVLRREKQECSCFIEDIGKEEVKSKRVPFLLDHLLRQWCITEFVSLFHHRDLILKLMISVELFLLQQRTLHNYWINESSSIDKTLDWKTSSLASGKSLDRLLKFDFKSSHVSGYIAHC